MSRWKKRGGKASYVTFAGKAVYLKVYTPDEYNGVESWKVGLTVTKDEWEKIRATGCQARKKFAEDVPGIDEGTPFVTFRRYAQKEFSDGLTHFCPPYILDKDGKKLIWYEKDGKQVYQFKDSEETPERMGEQVLIGNGSDIEVTVSIYDSGSFGKGTRVESVRVIDLIEYVPPSDEDDKWKTEEELAEEKPKVEKTEKKETKSKVGW